MINWIPPTSLYSGYGPMAGDTAEEDMPVHHTRIISDMNDVAEGCFLPKQISSETTVAEPDRHVRQYSLRSH